MKSTHDIPEIYRTDIPYITKCAIVKQLCLAQAAYAGVYQTNTFVPSLSESCMSILRRLRTTP